MVHTPSDTWMDFDGDIDVVQRALEAVASWADEPAVRCRSDRRLAQVCVNRTSTLVGGEWMVDEMNHPDDNIDPGPDVTDLRDLLLETLVPAFSRISLPRPVDLESLSRNWDAMRTALQTARRTCSSGGG